MLVECTMAASSTVPKSTTTIIEAKLATPTIQFLQHHVDSIQGSHWTSKPKTRCNGHLVSAEFVTFRIVLLMTLKISCQALPVAHALFGRLWYVQDSELPPVLMQCVKMQQRQWLAYNSIAT